MSTWDEDPDYRDRAIGVCLMMANGDYAGVTDTVSSLLLSETAGVPLAAGKRAASMVMALAWMGGAMMADLAAAHGLTPDELAASILSDLDEAGA